MQPRIKKVLVIWETEDGEQVEEFKAKEYHTVQERGIRRDYRGSKDGSPVNLSPNGNYRFTITGWTGPQQGNIHNSLG